MRIWKEYKIKDIALNTMTEDTLTKEEEKEIDTYTEAEDTELDIESKPPR